MDSAWRNIYFSSDSMTIGWYELRPANGLYPAAALSRRSTNDASMDVVGNDVGRKKDCAAWALDIMNKTIKNICALFICCPWFVIHYQVVQFWIVRAWISQHRTHDKYIYVAWGGGVVLVFG